MSLLSPSPLATRALLLARLVVKADERADCRTHGADTDEHGRVCVSDLGPYALLLMTTSEQQRPANAAAMPTGSDLASMQLASGFCSYQQRLHVALGLSPPAVRDLLACFWCSRQTSGLIAALTAPILTNMVVSASVTSVLMRCCS